MTMTRNRSTYLRRLSDPIFLARAFAPLAVLAAAAGAGMGAGTAIVLAAAAWLGGRALDSRRLPLRLTPFAAPIAGAATVLAGVAAAAGALALAGTGIAGDALVVIL